MNTPLSHEFFVILRWTVCLFILFLGMIHTFLYYLEFLTHPAWSAAHYVVLFTMIPYIAISGVAFAVLYFLCPSEQR
ncbi:hypothetical protein ALMA_1218 [Alloscardovia macacae]|uniref:Uncharacterized protein n=1 Tax=Alloscardovia macacae TaxID=1160091 RepID=A0A261F3K7_9BIFI|nr:hypothetical protein ALMA_1218 [Alloscardovia macacae]